MAGAENGLSTTLWVPPSFLSSFKYSDLFSSDRYGCSVIVGGKQHIVKESVYVQHHEALRLFNFASRASAIISGKSNLVLDSTSSTILSGSSNNITRKTR